MKKSAIPIFLILFTGLFTGVTFGGESVRPPWEEFKQLYQESVERKIMDLIVKEPFVFSIENASYSMKISSEGCTGEMTLNGKSISGKPEPISILKNNTIIQSITEVTGGALLCGEVYDDNIVLLPKGIGDFQIQLTFFIPAQEDNRSRFVSLAIPGAIRNSISYNLSQDITLVEAPGVKNKSGTYNFSTRSNISLRFADKKQVAKDAAKRKEDLSQQYKTVSTPPIVLDSVACFTSFEENGSALSVIVMDLPPEAGSNIKINSIPAAEIWSLKVNGKKRKVYSSDAKESQWIIPLSKGKASHVELALLREGEKMGLHGRLVAYLPGMEFPSRKVYFAIALPERVQLMSFEGPLNPALKSFKNAPREFIGKPYYFSKSFYKGAGMKVAVFYKEPVN